MGVSGRKGEEVWKLEGEESGIRVSKKRVLRI
jgi:hypothetical protein